METAGIIAEYNPFHNGHAWQIQQIRETLGKDCAIIVALSGNFCQRGEPALLNAWKRAEIALKLGCDLVLELPTAFSTASAERFAEGGVHLLAATGVVNHLVFGSEHGILDDLQSCAEQLSDENTVYRGMLHKALGNGLSYPAARQEALREQGLSQFAELLNEPNNILAIEYLRALQALPANRRKPLPITFRRQGTTLRDSSLPDLSATESERINTIDAGRNVNGQFASASAIRKALLSGTLSERIAALHPFMPPASFAPLLHALTSSTTPSLRTLSDYAPILLHHLNTRPADELSLYRDMQNGLAERLVAIAANSSATEEAARNSKVELDISRVCPNSDSDSDTNSGSDRRYLFDSAAEQLESIIFQTTTRAFPRTRVQRALTALLLGIRRDDAALTLEGPAYIRVLAFNRNGRHLLKLMRRHASLPVVTRASDFLEQPKDSTFYRQGMLDRRAADIHSGRIGFGAEQTVIRL